LGINADSADLLRLGREEGRLDTRQKKAGVEPTKSDKRDETQARGLIYGRRCIDLERASYTFDKKKEKRGKKKESPMESD